MPHVRIPPPYRGPTRGEEFVEVAGATVRECVAAVDATHPGFADQILGADGTVHGFVTLFINGNEIARGDVDAAVAPGDEVAILAAIAGG